LRGAEDGAGPRARPAGHEDGGKPWQKNEFTGRNIKEVRRAKVAGAGRKVQNLGKSLEERQGGVTLPACPLFQMAGEGAKNRGTRLGGGRRK